MTNRAALAVALSYPQELRQHLGEYFRTGQPVTNETLSKTFAENKWEWKSLYPIALQHSAWDLALATQALEYVDPQVAFTLSRVYTSQAAYDRLEDKATGAVYSSMGMPSNDFRGFVQIVQSYLGDASVVEPALLKAYDDALPQINRALGERSESTEQAPK
jgi:hypothetical protein